MQSMRCKSSPCCLGAPKQSFRFTRSLRCGRSYNQKHYLWQNCSILQTSNQVLSVILDCNEAGAASLTSELEGMRQILEEEGDADSSLFLKVLQVLSLICCKIWEMDPCDENCCAYGICGGLKMMQCAEHAAAHLVEGCRQAGWHVCPGLEPHIQPGACSGRAKSPYGARTCFPAQCSHVCWRSLHHVCMLAHLPLCCS